MLLFDLLVELYVIEESYMLIMVDLKEALEAHKRSTRVKYCFELL